jgi:hypothetical protein
MFSTKSPIVKIGGYIILFLFVAIIAISFGMPDFMSRMGLDTSVVAIVNDEKVHRLDFLRFRDSRFRDMRSEEMDDLILNYYIGEVLLLQKSDKMGFDVSDDRVADAIREIPGLVDPATGTIDEDQFRNFLQRNHLSTGELRKLFRGNLLKEDFLTAVRTGIPVSKDDIDSEIAIESFRCSFKYSYLSFAELKKANETALAVTDAEIDAEMAKDKTEVKDPKSDRERVKKKLEAQKLNDIKRGISEKINAIAKQGGSFNEAAIAMKGKASLSAEFKPGEEVKDMNDGKSLTAITASDIFLTEFFHLNNDKVSRIIETPAGFYIFSPVKKQGAAAKIASKETEAERNNIANRLKDEAANGITTNMLTTLQEKSKIVKNLKPGS